MIQIEKETFDVGNPLVLTHSGHGDHQEVDTVPVAQALAVGEVGRVSRIFQLKNKSTCNVSGKRYHEANIIYNQLINHWNCFWMIAPHLIQAGI